MLHERNLNQSTKFHEDAKRNSGWGKRLIKAKNLPHDDSKIIKPNTMILTISKVKYSNEEQKISCDVEQIPGKEFKLNRQTIFSQKDIYKSIPVAQKSKNELKEEISRKMFCYVTKQNIFDPLQPTLGYTIYLDKDPLGRVRPICTVDMLTYDGYKQCHEEQNALRNSQYAYWLPLYINQAHFERSKHYILNSIAMIYSRARDEKSNQFEPRMILKVLPPILVRTVMMLVEAKGESLAVIAPILERYCHIYQLLVKLVDEFPELREILDEEVEDFCLREENRHKKQLGDLGEFVIKLALSTKGLKDMETNNLLLKERLARQVSWALKTDKGLQQYQECEDLVERFMSATRVSNQLFLIQLEAARLLLDDCVKAELEERCGILEEGKMKMFKERIEWIKKNIGSDWKVYAEGIGQGGYVYSDQVMKGYIMKAFSMAKNKGYLN